MWENDDTPEGEDDVRTASAGAETFGEAEADGSPRNLSFASIALGLAGILIGGMALFLNLNTSPRLDNASTAILDAVNEIQTLRADVDDLTERVATLEAASERRRAEIRTMAQDAQQSLDAVGREMRRDRELIEELQSRLSTLAPSARPPAAASTPAAEPTRSAGPPASRATAGRGSSAGQGSADAPAEVAPETTAQRTHVIESGDTLSSLARRYGVSITEIQEANPGIDPRRLQLGQEVIIPSPQ